METLKEIIQKEGTVIIDVRDPWNFESGHITDALNIPLNEIPGRIDELKKINGSIIFYCQRGNKSKMALSLSRQAGLNNIYDGGGIEDLQMLKLN